MGSFANPLIPQDYDYYGAPPLPGTPRNPIPYQQFWGIQDAAIHGRQRAAGAEDMYAQRWRDLDYPYYGQEQRYRQLADQAYEPVLRGQGGYSPYEQSQLRMSPQEEQGMYLQDWERAGIQGNPDEQFRYYNPGLQWGLANEADQRLREGLGEGRMGIENAYQYGENNTQGLLGQVRGDIQSSIDPGRLRLSEGFAENYPLSDEEIQQMAELSGRAASMKYQSAYDDIERRARASGMTSPLALGTLGSRLNREGAIEASDALTRAKLGGLGLQRDQMAQAEQMRLDAERGLTDRRLGSYMQYGNLAGGLYEGNAGRRLSGELGYLGQRTGAEQYLGGLKAGTGEYLTDTGMGAQRYSEAERSRRAGDLAYNRQGTNQYLTGERYNRNRDIYGQRRADEQEGRGYLTGQQQYQGGQYQRGADRELQAYQAATRNQGGFLGQQIQNRATQGPVERWGTRLLGTGNSVGEAAGWGFAEGGVVTEPTNALIGEGGEPEVVIPMSKVGDDEFARLASLVYNPSSGEQGAVESTQYENIRRGPGEPHILYSDYRTDIRKVNRPSV